MCYPRLGGGHRKQAFQGAEDVRLRGPTATLGVGSSFLWALITEILPAFVLFRLKLAQGSEFRMSTGSPLCCLSCSSSLPLEQGTAADSQCSLYVLCLVSLG